MIQLFSRVDIARYTFKSIYKDDIQTLPVLGLKIFQSKAKNNNNKKTGYNHQYELIFCDTDDYKRALSIYVEQFSKLQ